MTRHKRFPSGNLVLLILAGIALCLVMLGYGFTYALRQTFGGGPKPATSLEQLSSRTHVTFPPASRLIDGVICRAWHSHAYVRVSIPPEQVPAFWRQSLFETSEVASRPTMSFQSMLGPRLVNEWKLWKIKDFRYNTGGSFHSGGGVDALISLDDPAQPVLYLYWWTG